MYVLSLLISATIPVLITGCNFSFKMIVVSSGESRWADGSENHELLPHHHHADHDEKS